MFHNLGINIYLSKKLIFPQDTFDQYKIDADDAIATAANLTDQQKMRAEFFDTKFPFIQPSLSHVCKNCTLVSNNKNILLKFIKK